MILYYLFRVLEFFLLLLPRNGRRNFFLLLAKIAYIFDRKYKNVVEQNLKMAYGDKVDKEQIKEIRKECYSNLLLNFEQVLENTKISPKEIEKLITIENRGVVDDALENSRPIIFISAHFDNWELGAVALSTLVTPTMNTYKKLNNPYFNRYLVESRSRLNIELVEKNGAMKKVIKALKNSQAVGFLVDQNIASKYSLKR